MVYMYLYEYSLCDKCGKSYRGKFKLNNEGKVNCLDCNEPEYIEELQWREVEDVKGDILSEIVKDLLRKDLNRIYIPRLVGEDEIKFLRDSKGNVDSRKVYFQGNPIEFVMMAHQYAYKALSYIETGEEKYIKTAKKVLDEYLRLRFNKFTKEERNNLVNIYKTDDMEGIIKEVDNL